MAPPADTVANRSRHWVNVIDYRAMARLADAAMAVATAFGVATAITLLQFVAILVGWDIEDELGDVRSTLALAGAAAFHLYNNVWRVSRTGSSLGQAQLGLVIGARGGGLLDPVRALLREALAAGAVWIALIAGDTPRFEVQYIWSGLAAPVVAVVVLAVVHLAVSATNAQRRTIPDLVTNSAVHSRDASHPPGVHRDVRVFKIVGQVVAVIIVYTLGRWLVDNLFTNLDETGISTSFEFLDRPTQFEIPFDQGFDPRSPIRSMVWAGVRNTALSALVGIIIATVLGTLIGIARLSTNWVVARLATLYVETLRNIPPLVIIVFFGFAIFTFGQFPILSGTSEPIQYSLPGSDNKWLILSNTVWGIPSFASDGNTGIFWLLALVAIAAAVGVWIWRTRLNIRTGAPHHRVLWSLATLVVLVVVAYAVTAGPYQMSWPRVSENGRRLERGFVMNFGWISVTVALGLYTASHVAEIIRGSILAVPRGQTEASNALALSGFQRYRYVILPQASRIAIPPTINQYLNLTKNTSLGIAVAYAESTALTKTSIGNGRPAVQSLVILMTIYLTFSFTISIVMNQVNKRVQLVDR